MPHIDAPHTTPSGTAAAHEGDTMTTDFDSIVDTNARDRAHDVVTQQIRYHIGRAQRDRFAAETRGYASAHLVAEHAERERLYRVALEAIEAALAAGEAR